MAIVAFFQNRLGRTDGVSLEVDKWRTVLRDRWGHEVLYCSGNDDVPGNIVIPELYAHHPVTWKILQNGTVAYRDYASEAELEDEIYRHADTLERKLLEVIETYRIELLIPNNLCSVGYQPAAAIAFHRVIRKTGLPAILHSHDFYFEESGEVEATCHTVASIYDRYLPTRLPRVQHVVINRLAQAELRSRKAIEATVVPNVFDFDQKPWVPDPFNEDLRSSFGIANHDLVFLQATRVLDRKGIELAIDLVARLGSAAHRKGLQGVVTAGGERFGDTSRLVLFCAGIVETIGISASYWNSLLEKARAIGVVVIAAGDRIRHSRGTEGQKTWSLWDTYTMADFVTYPSLWEGWGNQFIEAVFARLPVVVFEYPVWKSDLGHDGFSVVSLGSIVDHRDSRGLAVLPDAALDRAATAVVALLGDPERRKREADKNFTLGQRLYSIDALEAKIKPLWKKAGLGGGGAR